MKRYLQLSDIYMQYPLKKRVITDTTVKLPYVKKEEHTEEEYSLSFDDWNNIITTYLSCLLEKLLEGELIVLPRQMGALQVVRRKAKTINRKLAKQGKIQRYNKLHTMGYSPYVIWYREKYARFSMMMYYKFNFTRSVWLDIKDKINENPHFVFSNYENIN